MNKEEFLQALRKDLSGDVPASVVEENVDYYREYIESEVAKGRFEEEVVDELGAPRLIAKNIEDTTDAPEDEGYGQGYAESGYSEGYQGADQYGTYRGAGKAGRGDPAHRRSFHLFDLSKWYGWVMLVLVIVMVLYVAFAVISGLFTLLAPFLVPCLLIWLVISLFTGSRRR